MTIARNDDAFSSETLTTGKRSVTFSPIDYLRKVRGATPTAAYRATSSAPSSAQLDLHLRVERAFTQLSPKLRLVAELGLVDEWSVEEIAAALGITRTAVKFRLIRARNSLRKALERQGIQP